MSSADRPHSGSNWHADWGVDLDVAITRSGLAVVDEDQAEVLAAIGRYNSISAAARGIGISYRHAWKLVQQANEAAGVPLVEAATGGLRGGGATLTDRGRLALETYHQLQSELAMTSGAVLKRIVDSSGDAVTKLHLAVAISLQEVAGQLLAEYAQVRPVVQVRAVFGATNELAEHLMAGAPCDLFISADAAHLDRLESSGFVEAGSCRKLAANGLAAIGPLGGTVGVRRPRDLLLDSVRHVALADPACPLGTLSKQFLEASGLYEPLQPKALFVDNSRGILAAIHSGVAEVGLAFTSDAAKTGECQTLFQLRPGQASMECAAAVGSHTGNAAEANRLLDFFASAAARRCFRRCGFRPI